MPVRAWRPSWSPALRRASSAVIPARRAPPAGDRTGTRPPRRRGPAPVRRRSLRCPTDCRAAGAALRVLVVARHYILLRRRHAQQLQAVLQHLPRRGDQVQPRVAQADVVDDELVRVVVSVEVAGEVAQVVRELMRLQRARRGFQQLRIVGEAADQRFLVRLGQPRDVALADLALVRVPFSCSWRNTLQMRACAYCT